MNEFHKALAKNTAMNTDTHELDLLKFTRLVLDDDPVILVEVLQTADRLQEQGRHQQAAVILQRLAERLIQPDCQLPPLARCHLFAKLGGVLTRLRNLSEAEAWLRRAVALAEESRLSELSRRDFKRALERMLENTAEKPITVAPSESPHRTVPGKETAVAAAGSTETIGSHSTDKARRQVAMQQLTCEQRKLLEWCGRERRSVDEIAQKLGLPSSEVVLRLSEAMNRFNAAIRRLEAQSSAEGTSAQSESAASIQLK